MPAYSHPGSDACITGYFLRSLLSLPASLLAIAFTGQRLLDAEFLAGLQVKRMSFDFSDDVFVHDLPFEPSERIFQRLAFLKPYFSQLTPPGLTVIPIRCCAFTATRSCSDRIILSLPRLKPSRREPAFP